MRPTVERQRTAPSSLDDARNAEPTTLPAGRSHADVDARWTRSSPILALTFLLIAGCGSVTMRSYGDRHIEGFTFPTTGDTSECASAFDSMELLERSPTEQATYPEDILDTIEQRVAKYNRCVLERHYTEERAYYPNGRDHRPILGIALSGGGMRSASYAIGVLSSLMERGELEDLDLISAVSGGAYALSWLYAQPYYTGEANLCGSGHAASWKEMLEPGSPYQTHLGKHGGLVGLRRGFGYMISNVATIPFNFLANGLFGWHANTTPARGFYEDRIEHVYHRVPPDACGGKTNSRTIVVASFGTRQEIPLYDLGRFAKEHGLPYFVINASARVDDDPGHHGAILSNTVFELTPLRIGSDGFGYIEHSPDAADPDKWQPTLGRAVAISGAALDGSIITGASQQTFWSMLNQDLGMYVDNDVAKITPRERRRQRMLPFPAYFRDPYVHDADGHRIHLSDGGHAENLGLFSLVRRLPHRVIVVDAEHDAIRCSDLVERKTFAAERCEELRERSDKDDRLGAYVAKFGSYHRLKAALKREMGVELSIPDIETKVLRPYRAPQSIFYGQICGFPLAPLEKDKGTVRQHCIEVTYIKLSIDGRAIEREPDTYPETVSKYYRRKADDRCDALGTLVHEYCPFPQQKTTDQSFSRSQFNAYRDLGRWTVCTQYAPPGRPAPKPCAGIETAAAPVIVSSGAGRTTGGPALRSRRSRIPDR